MSPFIITTNSTNYEKEFVDSSLNYITLRKIISNQPKSKGDSYFVNSEIKLTDGMSIILTLKMNTTTTLKDYHIFKYNKDQHLPALRWLAWFIDSNCGFWPSKSHV